MTQLFFCCFGETKSEIGQVGNPDMAWGRVILKSHSSSPNFSFWVGFHYRPVCLHYILIGSAGAWARACDALGLSSTCFTELHLQQEIQFSDNKEICTTLRTAQENQSGSKCTRKAPLTAAFWSLSSWAQHCTCILSNFSLCMINDHTNDLSESPWTTVFFKR